MIDEEELSETSFYITEHLGETKPYPRGLIRTIVKELGCEPALAYLKEAREIEKGGGMLTLDGKKRRTVGGVFFRLVREKADPESVARLWPPKHWKTKAEKRAEKAKAQAKEQAHDDRSATRALPV